VCEVDYIRPDESTTWTVSPRQMVSWPTAMIPFLEHPTTQPCPDGLDMQRHSRFPLLPGEAPLSSPALIPRRLSNAATSRPEFLAWSSRSCASLLTVGNDGRHADHDYLVVKFPPVNMAPASNQKPWPPGPAVEVGRYRDRPCTDTTARFLLVLRTAVAFMSVLCSTYYEYAIILSPAARAGRRALLDPT